MLNFFVLRKAFYATKIPLNNITNINNNKLRKTQILLMFLQTFWVQTDYFYEVRSLWKFFNKCITKHPTHEAPSPSALYEREFCWRNSDRQGKSAPLYRHWGSVQVVRPIGGVEVLFLDHGTRRGWGVSVTPRPLFTPGKDPVPIVREVGWAAGPVWTGAENLAPTGIRSPDRPARSQSLYRLSYPAHG